MWTIDDWMLEVRKHFTDYDKYLDVDMVELEELFDQGLSPVEVLLYFLEN